jgi:TPR repeat protein
VPDPIKNLIEEVKGYERAQDWSMHHRASLSLVQRLTTAGEPISTEHQEALQLVMEGLRNKGLGLKSDEFRAYEDNIRSAAHHDIMPAILILADNLRLKDAPEAFDWYYYAAEARHNTEAAMNLAWLYFGGKCGQHPDKETAFKWFKRAFESGSTAAGTVVANCYLRGDGTPKDEDAAIRILLPLADGGEARAMTLLGQCYYNGTGHLTNLPQEERDRKAKAYFEKAILGGDWAACGHLGVMFETGRGASKDWKAAVKLYLKGVDHQNPVCMYYYALALENHRAEIVKIFGREDKAETYYKKAAAASVTQAVQWCVEHNIKY